MAAPSHSVGKVLSRSKPGPYVCLSCRNSFLQTGVTTQQKRFVSKEISPLSQTYRRTSTNSEYLSRFPNSHATHVSFQKRQLRTQTQSRAQAQELPSEPVWRPNDLHSPARTEELQKFETTEKYEPAETWDGLEHVGYDGNWRNVPSKPTDTFYAWLDSDTGSVKTREETVSCLHQAIVECLTCQEAGLTPSIASEVDFTGIDHDAFASIKINLSKAGQPVNVKFASQAHHEEVIEILSAANTETLNKPQESMIETEESSENDDVSEELLAAGYTGADIQGSSHLIRNNAILYPVRDQSFLDARLDAGNPMTFTILKRFSQLSGKRVPDPVINTLLSSNQPLSSLIERFYISVIHPKPKKVAEILMTKPDLTSQSNLMVFPRRETSVDKHKEVGRWKIIEKELHERGLPSLGKIKLR